MASSLDPTARDNVLESFRDAVPELVAVYQFGSSVQSSEHAESGFDPAILARQPLQNLDRWTLQEDLAAQFHRNVDLVDLRSASTVMQKEVVSRSVVLAERDRTARQQFEMRVYSAYAMLNEERAGILEDVQARGRVYGR